MNVPEFHKFLEKNKEYIGWINSNSKFVEVKHKLWLEDKPYNDEEPYYDLELKKFVFFKFNSFMSRRICKSEQKMEVIDVEADPNAMEIEKEPVLFKDCHDVDIDLEKEEPVINVDEDSDAEDYRALNEMARQHKGLMDSPIRVTPLKSSKPPKTPRVEEDTPEPKKLTISEKQDRLKELTRIKTCLKDYVVQQMTKIKDEIKQLTDDYNPLVS